MTLRLKLYLAWALACTVFSCFGQTTWTGTGTVIFNVTFLPTTAAPIAIPAIVTNPTNRTALTNDTVSFYVTATGPGLGYYWRTNGVAASGGRFSGETTTTLTYSNVLITDSNYGFSCLVSNSAGMATSTVATLTVTNTPVSGDPIIPATRLADWSHPGVPGGITNRTTVYTTLNAGDSIQTAITNCPVGQVVQLNAGTWTVNSPIYLYKAITLRGSTNAQGNPTTILKRTSAGGNIIQVQGSTSETGSYGNRTLTPLASDWVQGTTNFVTTSAAGLSVGTWLNIVQSTPPWVFGTGANGPSGWQGRGMPTYRVGQMVNITAINGTTIYVDRPAYFTYPTSRAASHTPFGVLRGAGVEDLVLWRSNSTDTSGYNVDFEHTDACWLKNVSSTNTLVGHFYFRCTSQVTIDRCYIDSMDDSFLHSGSKGYGIFFDDYNSDALVIDNTIKGCRHAIFMQGGVSGTVVAYNLVHYGHSDDAGFVGEDMGTHTSHPFFNLFEGNICNNLWHDNTLGSASHNLSYRNWFRNMSDARPSGSGRYGWTVKSQSWSNSLMGTVIGTGTSSYQLGWWDTYIQNPLDTNVAATAYIHGNYYFNSGTVGWASSNANHTLPDSMWLNSKPARFGNCPWPPFDPYAAGSVNITNIPAGNR